jgi:transposase
VIHRLPASTGGFHVGVASFRAYSQDLRDRVLSADGIGSGKVAVRYGVSISYVVKARQRRDRLGAVTPGAQRSHTPAKLAGHEAAIRAQVRLRPDMTLDELRAWILAELGIAVSVTTVWKISTRAFLPWRRS